MGAHQLCTVTLMDAGERPDFLLKHSSVKICLLSSLYEPIAESLRRRKRRNWASRIDGGDKDKNKGESGVRNKVAESMRRQKKKKVVRGDELSSVQRKVRQIKREHIVKFICLSFCLDSNFFPSILFKY